MISMRSIKHWLIGLALVLFVNGCTSPLWWNTEERYFVYRGFNVRIVSQGRVWEECGPLHGGCVKINEELGLYEIWSVNNPYILKHECGHVDALLDGGPDAVAGERIKDAFMDLTGLNALIALITSMVPADKCELPSTN
jgi:hypothetical protein